MTLSDAWHALVREAEFAAESMAIGVTALGNIDHMRLANYAQMFFSLSSGLERASKLALCLEYAALHGEYPKAQYIKNYGHNLQELLIETDRIGKTYCTNDVTRLPNSEISNAIIKILSDFATNITRYYNFDFLGGEADDKSYDPIEIWHREVSSVVLKTHLTEKVKNRILVKAQVIGSAVDSFTFVLDSREDRSPIEDVSTALEHFGLGNFEKPYTRMYILQIVRFVAKVIVEISDIAQNRLATDDPQGQPRAHVPYMIEIFGLFYSDDRYFRSRKTWSIYRR